MKKILTSFLTIILTTVLLVGSVYAAQLEAKIEVSADKTEVKVGDTVTFTFKTTKIANAEDNSISAISGVVEWDKNFFEVPTTGSGTATLNKDTGDFNCVSIVSEGGTNGTLILKVKEGATGSGKVKFTGLEASDGRVDAEGTAKTEDQEITITIKSESTDNGGSTTGTGDSTTGEGGSATGDGGSTTGTGGSTTGEGGSTTGEGGSTTGEGGSTTDGKKVSIGDDDTVADKDYDDAGINIIIIVAISMSLMFAIVIYKKNQKYRDIK